MIKIEFTGNFVSVSPVQTLTKKSDGTQYHKAEVIFSHNEGQYTDNVVMTVIGDDKISALQSMRPGVAVNVKGSIRAREWNGRWYNDVTLFTAVAHADIGEAPKTEGMKALDERFGVTDVKTVSKRQDDELPF